MVLVKVGGWGGVSDFLLGFFEGVVVVGFFKLKIIISIRVHSNSLMKPSVWASTYSLLILVNY